VCVKIRETFPLFYLITHKRRLTTVSVIYLTTVEERRENKRASWLLWNERGGRLETERRKAKIKSIREINIKSNFCPQKYLRISAKVF